MSVSDLIKKFEAEKSSIHAKIAELQERDSFLDSLLKELGAAAGGKAKAPAKKSDAPAKAAGKTKRGRKKKGGMTVREAIIKTVAGAPSALRAGEIIEKAVALSGGAEASIRTQINALTKAEELKQVPFEGRGFKYQIAGGEKKAASAPKKAETPKK